MSAGPVVAVRQVASKAWANSAVRYLVVGAFAFAFDVALLFLLHEALGIPLVVATPAAFLASFVVTYTLQRVFAFRSASSVAPSLLRYGLLVAFNTLATTVLVAVPEAWGMPWFWAKVLSVVVTTVWNYFIYKYWVFARVREIDV